MGRRAAIALHLALFAVGAALYVLFVIPRWWVLTGDIPTSLAAAGRIAAGLPIALAALPVVLNLKRALKPENNTPELALRLRAWSLLLHVLAGALIIAAAVAEIWLGMGAAGAWLFGVYGAGAAALRVKADGVEKLWSGEEQLTVQYVTPVLRDGFLYGFEGRVDTGPKPELRCVELATGKVSWSTSRVVHGGIILAGSDLIIVSDSGELVRVAADPKAFVEKARAQILGREGRAQPALADGLLFARDKTRLVAVDLLKK
ncbi:MAG: hypothetical protein EBS05_22675 [Proteobacteria bacterium]|nr:hypothetical protein [Pseudomonadota bacterium]